MAFALNWPNARDKEGPAPDAGKEAPSSPAQPIGTLDFSQLGGAFPGQSQNTVRQYGAEAERIRQEEEKRREQALSYMTQARTEAAQPTIDQNVINNLFGASIAQEGMQASRSNQMLGSQMGSQGTFGGGAAGAAFGQVEAQRLASLAHQQGSIANLVAQDRGAAQVRAMEMDRAVAGLMNQDPAMTTADFLGQLLQGDVALALGDKQLAAAQATAGASKKSGIMDLIGGLAGGAIAAFL